VPDDAAVFLVGAGDEAGRIHKGDNRDVVSVAEADKAADLVAGVNVNGAAHHIRFLRDNPNRHAAHPRQPHDGIAGKPAQQFQEGAAVHDIRNGIVHGIRHTRIHGDQLVEAFVHAGDQVAGIGKRGIFHVVVGEITEHLAHGCQCLLVGGGGQVCQPADGVVRHGSAEGFGVHFLVRDGLDHIGSGEEHVGLFLHHDDDVRQSGRVGGTTGAGSHDHADLRDNPGVLGVAPEDFGISAQAANTFLDARPTGVNQANNGSAVAHRQVHHLADLVGLHFTQRTALDSKILGIDVHRPPINPAKASDHAIAGGFVRLGAGFIVPLDDKGFHLLEGAGVQQDVHPLAGSQLALGMLGSNSFFAAALAGFGAHLAQFQYSGIFFRHALSSSSESEINPVGGFSTG